MTKTTTENNANMATPMNEQKKTPYKTAQPQ
jgi:hypothetical protein